MAIVSQWKTDSRFGDGRGDLRRQGIVPYGVLKLIWKEAWKWYPATENLTYLESTGFSCYKQIQKEISTSQIDVFGKNDQYILEEEWMRTAFFILVT